MKILIFREKHGNRYFDASSQDKIEKACLKIIKERIKHGWHSLTPCKFLAANLNRKPEIPYDEIFKFKDGPIKTEALRQWREYNCYVKQIEQEKAEIEILKKIKKGDQKLAWEYVQTHRDGEYEGYEFETLEEVE